MLLLCERLRLALGELRGNQIVDVARRGRQLRHDVVPEELARLHLLVSLGHGLQLDGLDVVDKGQDGQRFELHL